MASCTAAIFTTHEQAEQPALIHHVTAISVVGDGLLTLECDATDRGSSFTGYHRFEPGEWTHFSVTYVGGGGG